MSAAADLATVVELAGVLVLLNTVGYDQLTETFRCFTLQVEPAWRSGMARRNGDQRVFDTPDRLFEGAIIYASLVLAVFGLHCLVDLKWDLSWIHLVSS